jgi:organic radical activating enzyme
MQKYFSRLFPTGETPEPLTPGVYQLMFPENVESPNRLHLRIEPNGNGLLLVNAATVLHLNSTAAEHVYFWLEGKSEGDAAQEIARRYRVSQAKAFTNQRQIREQIMSLANTPDLDPVLFIGLDRTEPYSESPPAPYRLDCALTYKIDLSGTYDPLARARVDTELTTEEWMKILSKAWDFGIPHVTFTGGEPCLWDDLPKLIAHSENLGQITGVLTNGQRLADKSYLSELDQSGLDHILITFEPGNKKSVKGLEATLATDIFTAVHLNVNDSGALQELDELYAMGVTAVSLSTDGEQLGSLEEARDHAASIGLDLIWDLPVPYSSRNPISLELEGQLTGDGRAWLYVEPDADILPAQGIDVILGNILKDSWQDIWDQAQAWHSKQTANN